MSTQTPQRNYQAGTRPRKEGLFGYSHAVTIIGFVTVPLALLIGLFEGIVVAGVILGIGLLLVVPAVWHPGGRTAYEQLWLVTRDWGSRLRRETVYNAGGFSRFGSHRQPGILAASELFEYFDAAGRRFAMIWYKEFSLCAVPIRCSPQGSEAIDQDDIDTLVGTWAEVQATLGGEHDVEAIIPVHDSMPDSGQALEAELDAFMRPDGQVPQLVAESMIELAADLPSAGLHTECWCTLVFRVPSSRRDEPEEQAVQLARRLPGIVGALNECGLDAAPMDAGAVCALARRAWDPAAETDLDEAARAVIEHHVGWHDTGPAGYQEHTGYLWHDGAKSVTWEMVKGPDGVVTEQVLSRLLAPNESVPRKRVALVLRPHTAGEGAKIADNDYKDAIAAINGSRGLVAAAAEVRKEAAEQARDEQARGHGMTRYGILITITEPDADADIPQVAAIAHDLSLQARLKIRRCYRYQAAGFAAALGLGVVLPRMATVPKMLAEG